MKCWGAAIAIVAAVAVATTAFAYGSGHHRWQGERQACCGQGIGPTTDGESFGRGPGGHRARKLARYLDLTHEQTDRMVELGKKYAPKMKSLRNELFQKRVEARRSYADPNTDEATILAKQREVGNLEQRLRDDMARLRLEQRKLLTPEQMKKLAEFKPRREGLRRGKLLG